jgi:hypothetical protein
MDFDFDATWPLIEEQTTAPDLFDTVMDNPATHLLRSCDWLTPLLAGLGNLLHGGAYTVCVPYPSPWSGDQIERMIRTNCRCDVWGGTVINGEIVLNVPPRDGERVVAMLNRMGVKAT